MASKKEQTSISTGRATLKGVINQSGNVGIAKAAAEVHQVSPTKEFIGDIGVALYNAEQTMIELITRLALVSLENNGETEASADTSRAMSPIEHDLEHLLGRVKKMTQCLTDAIAMLRI